MISSIHLAKRHLFAMGSGKGAVEGWIARWRRSVLSGKQRVGFVAVVG